MDSLSIIIAPLCIALIGMAMLVCKRDMFSEFTDGAKEGLQTAVGLLPTLVALLCAISMFNASGAADYLTKLITPAAKGLGVPPEIIPFLVIRPLSGGASTAMISDVFQKYGADSFIGRCVSVIAGSSDTLLYIISVYFGAICIKKTRGTVPIALFCMLFCVIFALILCRIFFMA